MTPEREVPHSDEMEQVVIGSAILVNSLIAQIVDLLRVDEFYKPSHRKVLRVMIDLYSNGVDVNPATIAESLKRHGDLESVGGHIFLSDLIYGLPQVSSIAPYAKVVKEKAHLREVIRAGEQMINEAFEQEDDPGVIVDRAQDALLMLSRNSGRKVVSMKETAARAREHLRGLGRGENPAIATPWQQLNQACRGGLQPSELWGLIAPQKMGKSAVAKQWAWHASGTGHRVLIFSREMSDLKIFYRLLAPLTDIPVSQIRYGLDEDRIERSIKATVKLEDRGIFFDTETSDIDECRLRVREMVRLERIDFVIADYANQFSGVRRKGASRAEEVAYVWRSFKNIAQEFQIGVFTVGHPTSDSEKHRGKNEREAPYFHQSAESREAAKAVDVGMVLWTELNSGQPGARPATIYIDYQRDEEAGGQIPLVFDGRIMEFQQRGGLDFNL